MPEPLNTTPICPLFILYEIFPFTFPEKASPVIFFKLNTLFVKLKSDVKFSATIPPVTNFLRDPFPLTIGPFKEICISDIVRGISGILTNGTVAEPLRIGFAATPFTSILPIAVTLDLLNPGITNVTLFGVNTFRFNF